MIKNRFDIIKYYVKGKEVLDIGCVDHTLSNVRKPTWLHGLIADEAKHVLGVDVAKDEIDKLKDKGYDVIHGNFEEQNLGKEFQVIVAGNVIEHLYNVGHFLDNVKKHLKTDGVFLLTTDNCFGFRRWFYAFFRGRVPVNKTHTCYYDPETLTYLLTSKGFKVTKKFYFTDSIGWRYFIERIFGVRDVLCPYMLFVVEKA